MNRQVGLRKMRVYEACIGYTFVAPIVIGTLIFSIFPIFHSFFLSFMDWDGLGVKKYIGWQNYRMVFQDPTLARSLTNTFVYALGTVPMALLLSLILANKLNDDIKCKSAFRVIYYLPNVTMAAAVAMVWKWIFNGKYGIMNQIILDCLQ